MKCSEREAAECVIKALFKKQEEAFTSVALAQGLITDDKKKWMQFKLRLCYLKLGSVIIMPGYSSGT